jgi:mono/diheme cytochrome c family protein
MFAVVNWLTFVRRGNSASLTFVLSVILFGAGCRRASNSGTTEVPDDEAKANHLTAQSFRYEVTDKQNFFKGMDAIASPAETPDQLLESSPAARQLFDPVQTSNEILGRNTWMLWCAGNDGFWDWLAGHSYGFTDLLKLIDSRKRPTRFATAGLINEPGMKQAAQPDENGLWLDVPSQDQRHVPPAPEHIYGKSSGVIGLRLFPNPSFDEQAKAKWDGKRYYDDPNYYNNPTLVRPYRVGMSCAFCHASFHPLNPPANVAEPRWENVSGNIGAQYLRIRAVFGNLLNRENFAYHLLDSQPPGTTDTSLIPSDNLNNPNAMNAIFNLPQRVVRSFVNPGETLRGASLTQPAVWGHPTEAFADGADEAFVWQRDSATGALQYRGREADKVPKALWDVFEKNGLLDRVKGSNDVDKPRYVPRVLFDGADSIGAWGALARVFLNIGCFWEQWNHLHNPLVGFQPQSPFRIQDLVDHSVYWEATQERVAPLRDYFLKITPPMPLLGAKGADAKAEPIDVTKFKESVVTESADPFTSGLATNTGKLDFAKHIAIERAKRIDPSQLKRGRKVFANNCIVCHSSVQPENDPSLPPNDELSGRRKAFFEQWAKAGEFWDHDPGRWLEDDAYKKWAGSAVERPDFWRNNFLSTDYRLPVTLIGTNPARSLATNGLEGHMWSDFTSQSYKNLPSVGSIKYFNPYLGDHGDDTVFTPRHKAPEGSPEGGGGVGFYRPASLISVWATAPLLHNNSVGLFNNDPSVDGRLIAFDDAIRKLLWPAKRAESSSYNEATPDRLKRDHGLIWRTTQVTYLGLPAKYAPAIFLKFPFFKDWQNEYSDWQKEYPLAQWIDRAPWLPSAILLLGAYLSFLLLGRKRAPDHPALELRRKRLARFIGYIAIFAALVVGAFLYLITGSLGNVRIGPIPKGTPVSLLGSLNPEANPADVKKAISVTVETLAEIESQHLAEQEAQALLRKRVAPALMKVNKCPDFVMDEGHYFKWFDSMSDEDKNALIELLKTF